MSLFPNTPRARRERLGLLFAALVWFAGNLVLPARCASVVSAQEKPAAKSAGSQPEFEESWQVIYIGKARVGYGRSSISRKTRDGQPLVATETEMALALSRLGQPINMKTSVQTEETTEGDLQEFNFEMQAPPAQNSSVHGRVEGDKLALETVTNGKTRTTTQPWNSSLKSPALQERLLKEKPMKPGESRSFEAFVPEMGKSCKFTLKAGNLEDVALLGGKKSKLLHVTISQSIMPGMQTHEYVDAQGEAQKSTVSMAGLQLVMYKVDKQEALKALSGEEVDMVVSTLVKVKKIERPQKTRRAVYRVATPGEDPAKVLSAGPGQEIARIAPDTVDLTVHALLPPDEPPADVSPVPAEFSAPNPFLQSDDDLVREHASEATGDERDPWKAAQQMERWVFENIKKKNFSTLLASAAEVAKDLSGDCTEHAVLLAAMCRARGIPARVAIGLVYAPSLSSFGGHMWTEVFVNGAWIGLDATQGQGRVAADHIKFADSSLSDEGAALPVTSFLPMASVLGKMKIEVRDVKNDE